MVQEESNQICSNNSGGGDDFSGGGPGSGGSRSAAAPKKQKQKKLPQRGVGVAQLGRILAEEQQRRDATNAFLSHSPSAVSSTNSSSLPLSFLNDSPPTSGVHSHSSSSAIQFGPAAPSLTNTPSPNSLLLGVAHPCHFPPLPPPPAPSPLPSQNIDTHYLLNYIPRSLNPAAYNTASGSYADWSSFPAHGNSTNLPRMWRSPLEFNHEGDSYRWDHHDGVFPFRPSMSLPFDTGHLHIASPPDHLMLRSHQQYQHPPLVNVPSTSSMDSSAVQSTNQQSSSTVQRYQQIEPPSNQNYYGSGNALLRSEEKRAAAMKRPYPFSDENKIPPRVRAATSHRSQSDESKSSWTHSEHPIPLPVLRLREDPAYPTGVPEPVSMKSCSSSSSKGNESTKADFLTLALPSRTTTSNQSPSSKEPMSADDRQQSGGASSSSSQTKQSSSSFTSAAPVAAGNNNQKNSPNGEGDGSLDLKL